MALEEGGNVISHLFTYICQKLLENMEGVKAKVKTREIATKVQLPYQSGLHIHGRGLLSSHIMKPKVTLLFNCHYSLMALTN